MFAIKIGKTRRIVIKESKGTLTLENLIIKSSTKQDQSSHQAAREGATRRVTKLFSLRVRNR